MDGWIDRQTISPFDLGGGLNTIAEDWWVQRCLSVRRAAEVFAQWGNSEELLDYAVGTPCWDGWVGCTGLVPCDVLFVGSDICQYNALGGSDIRVYLFLNLRAAVKDNGWHWLGCFAW